MHTLGPTRNMNIQSIKWLFIVILASWISCSKYECSVVQDKVTGLGPKLQLWAYA